MKTKESNPQGLPSGQGQAGAPGWVTFKRSIFQRSKRTPNRAEDVVSRTPKMSNEFKRSERSQYRKKIEFSLIDVTIHVRNTVWDFVACVFSNTRRLGGETSHKGVILAVIFILTLRCRIATVWMVYSGSSTIGDIFGKDMRTWGRIRTIHVLFANPKVNMEMNAAPSALFFL